MLSPMPKMPEGQAVQTEELKKDLIVKMVSCEIAKRLGDAICVKYKKAFDLLKDK